MLQYYQKKRKYFRTKYIQEKCDFMATIFYSTKTSVNSQYSSFSTLALL